MAKQTLDFALLRSVIRCDPTDPEGDLRDNLDALRLEVVASGADAHLLHFVGQQRDRTGVVPDRALVEQHYAHLIASGDPYGLSGHILLNGLDAANLPCLDRSQFRYALDRFKETVISDTLAELMQQAAQVLTTGYTPPALPKGPPPKLLKGATDAVGYLRAGLDLVTSRFHSGAVEGSFRLDAAQVWDDYQKRHGHPPIGVLSGFHEIDQAHDGLVPGDLALVLGFTGHFKSTICLNWAYRAAVYQGLNVGIVPTEMRAATLLSVMAVMHSYHPRFRMQSKYEMTEVTYDEWRRGLLKPDQQELMQEVLEDLQKNPKYGQLVYMQPEGAVTVADVRRWAEQQHRKITLQLLLLDYMGQIDPSAGGSSMKEGAIMNAMIAETKKMAGTFGGGDGIAILSPFQASREGFKEAEKNGGVYTLRALSWANEAERSADFVYSSYSNDTLSNARELQLGNLKARDRRRIDTQLKVFCDPATRVIEQLDAARLYQSKATVVQGQGSA